MSSSEIILSIISITLLMVLLILAVILVIFQSNKRRLKQDMVMAQNKLSYEKELRQVETEVSEQVLSRLAQELHDNVGQLLTAVRIHVENQKVDHPELTESFKPAETYLTEASQQLRLLSRTLNNDYIGNIGLLPAIEVEIGRIRALRRFDVQWQSVTGNSNLDKNQEVMVFRIFQEIIQNALRHSMAKNAIISVANGNGNFEMKIEDDGVGFDADTMLKSSNASGLRNIIKRANWAGIDCTINSAPQKGCTITLKKQVQNELSA